MQDLLDFSDDTVVVGGGASGIGRGTAREFADAGASVVVADIDEEAGRAAAEEIADDLGAQAEYVSTDVGDYAACEELIATVADEFDGVDVLVNAAARTNFVAKLRPFREQEPDDWDPELRVTFMGIVNTTHLVLPHMVKQGSGAVVNFTSTSRRGQDPNHMMGEELHLTMYAAMKAAVSTFTCSLAKEVGEHGVRLNAIARARRSRRTSGRSCPRTAKRRC